MRVYVLITIDTECDKGKGWLVQNPLKFVGVEQGVVKFLQPLFDRYSIKPTYLLSPEILDDEPSVEVFKRIENCELGTHLHGEFISPGKLDLVDRTSTPQFFYPPEIEFEKLKSLTYSFKDRIGYGPRSFRAGRWGISKSTLGFLSDLGYLVDSSVCPFRTHYFDHGREINFWGSPVQPYYPSLKNFKKRGDSSVLEVPPSLGNPDLFRVPDLILGLLNDRSKIHRKILRRLGKSGKVSWLRPLKADENEMVALSKSFIKHFGKNGRPVFLNMMFHNNEVIPGASPYVHDLESQKKFLDSIDFWLKILSNEYDLRGIGLSEVPEYL